MNFVIGFLGGLAVVTLLSAGFTAGWQAHKAYMKSVTPKAEAPGEQERQKLIEQQQAFHMLQNYTTERAYGMTAVDDETGGGYS